MPMPERSRGRPMSPCQEVLDAPSSMTPTWGSRDTSSVKLSPIQGRWPDAGARLGVPPKPRQPDPNPTYAAASVGAYDQVSAICPEKGSWPPQRITRSRADSKVIACPNLGAGPVPG